MPSNRNAGSAAPPKISGNLPFPRHFLYPLFIIFRTVEKPCRAREDDHSMSGPEIPQQSNEVSDSWQQMVQAVLGIAKP